MPRDAATRRRIKFEKISKSVHSMDLTPNQFHLLDELIWLFYKKGRISPAALWDTYEDYYRKIRPECSTLNVDNLEDYLQLITTLIGPDKVDPDFLNIRPKGRRYKNYLKSTSFKKFAENANDLQIEDDASSDSDEDLARDSMSVNAADDVTSRDKKFDDVMNRERTLDDVMNRERTLDDVISRDKKSSGAPGVVEQTSPACTNEAKFSDKILQFVASMQLSPAQQQLLKEVVLLLNSTGPLDKNRIWDIYNLQYKKSPNCAKLGVSSMKHFVKLIADLVQEHQDGRLLLTQKGQQYVEYLLSLIQNATNNMASVSVRPLMGQPLVVRPMLGSMGGPRYSPPVAMPPAAWGHPPGMPPVQSLFAANVAATLTNNSDRGRSPDIVESLKQGSSSMEKPDTTAGDDSMDGAKTTLIPDTDPLNSLQRRAAIVKLMNVNNTDGKLPKYVTIIEYVQKLKLSQNQLDVLNELVLLMAELENPQNSLQREEIWREYRNYFKKEPNCLGQGIDDLNSYLEKISPIIGIMAKKSFKFPLKGRQYKNYLKQMITEYSNKKEPIPLVYHPDLSTGEVGTLAGQKAVNKSIVTPLLPEYTLFPSKNDPPPVFYRAPEQRIPFGTSLAASQKPGPWLSTASQAAYLPSDQHFPSLSSSRDTGRERSSSPAHSIASSCDRLDPSSKPKPKLVYDVGGARPTQTSTEPRKTPPGGEEFLLEAEEPEGSDDPKTVSRERLEALATKHIETIADQGEFVTPRRVEMMICQHLNIKQLNQITNVKLRRGIEELKAVQDLSRKVGQVDAHITASVALRNINTVYDMMNDMREGIPDKKPYDSLKLGPFTKNPLVQRIFSVPSGCEVPEISAIDVYCDLREFVNKNNLWTTQIKPEEFMVFLAEKYNVEDIYTLGIKIRSLALCMQNIKRAQRQEGNAVRGFYAAADERCKDDFEAAYVKLRTQLLYESEGTYTARQYYLDLPPIDVIKDVLGKYRFFLKSLIELGVQPIHLNADDHAITALEKHLKKGGLVKDMFKFAVIMNSGEMHLSVTEFMAALEKKKADEQEQKAKKEKIPRNNIEEKLLKFIDDCFANPEMGLSLKLLLTMERRCAKDFKRDSFLDLGHESFLDFILKDGPIYRKIEENGSVGLGGGSVTNAASVYRPGLSDIVELVLPAETKDQSTVEKLAAYHYRAEKYSHLGLGSARLILDRLDSANKRTKWQRNVCVQAGVCYDSKMMEVVNNRFGILGEQKVSGVVHMLEMCPLLEDLEAWSQWTLVYSQQHGCLKDFVEKHGGTGTYVYGDTEHQKDLSALEIEPGKLLRLIRNTDDDKFREVVARGDPREICGHLVSLVVLRGCKTVGLALLANVITAHLHKLCAVVPGAPPCDGNGQEAVTFLRDCLCLLPMMFCEKLADEVFITPLSAVLGNSESKTLLARSCTNFHHSNRLVVLGYLLGIHQWRGLFYNRPTDQVDVTGATASIEDGESQPETGSEFSDWESESEDEMEDDVEGKIQSKVDHEEQITSVVALDAHPGVEVDLPEDEENIELRNDATKECSQPETDTVQEHFMDAADTQDDINDMTTETGTQEMAEQSGLDILNEVNNRPHSETVNKESLSEVEISERGSLPGTVDETHRSVTEVITPFPDSSETPDSIDQTVMDDDTGSAERDGIVQELIDELVEQVINEADDLYLDLPPKERQCKKIIDNIRRHEFACGVQLDDTARRLVDTQQGKLKRALIRLSQDLYTKHTHFVLELVQNADDNNYGDVNPSLHFTIEKDVITVQNNETGFEERHVKALCDVGNSTKPKHQVGFIGQKGIGFKSVFRVSDQPEIHSNGYHFRFNMAEDEIGYILPHWITDDQCPDSNWMTTIVLPLKLEIKRKIESLVNSFKDIHPSLLLFLHRLRSLTIENKIKGTRSKMIRRDLGKKIIEIKYNRRVESWLVVRQMLDVTNLQIQIKGGANVEKTEIALAFPLCEKRPAKQSVFAFLPLRSSGFRFVIQGDFDLPSSREDLDSDSAWNQWLRKEIAPAFINALSSFSTVDKDPIQAVKRYLQFVASPDDVMDFFKPVADAILKQLSSKAFIPDSEGELRLPSQLVICSDHFVRETFPGHILKKYLDLAYIHPDVVTDENHSLLQQLGVRLLSTADLMVAVKGQCSQWEGQWDVHMLQDVAKILVCLQRSLAEADIHDETLENLQNLNIIPDCQHRLLQLSNQALFFPVNKPGFSKILAEDLCVVEPTLLNILDQVSNSQIVDMLEKLDVKRITPKDVIEHHILPIYKNGEWENKSRPTQENYVLFLYEHQKELSEIISWKDLSDVIQVATNQGLKNPSRDFIHFTRLYGNQLDLPTEFPGYKWCLLDAYPMRGSHATPDGWRQFFVKLGVLDFVAVKKVCKTVTPRELEDTVWKDVVKLLNSMDQKLIVSDWESSQLESLIQSAITSPGQSYKQMQKLMAVLGKDWRRFSGYTSAEIVDGSGRRHDVMSSFGHSLWSPAWVPGYKETVINVRSRDMRRHDSLYLGSDLFSPAGNAKHLLAHHVPYLDITQHCPPEFLQFLGIRNHVTCDELKTYFLDWIKEEFTTTADHIRSMYSYFHNKLPGDVLDSLFRQNNAIFVPDNMTSSLFVTGTFRALEAVCWRDLSGLLAKYNDDLKNSGQISVQCLSDFKDLYVHGKPYHAIRDCPTFDLYKQLLETICTYYPQCSTKISDVIKIYQILIQYRDPYVVRDWVKEFGKLKVIPTSRDRYVSLADQPLIADDERIQELFAATENVHFVDLSPTKTAAKRQKNLTPQERLDHDVLKQFLADCLQVRLLSQSYNEEVITEGIQPHNILQNYFHFMIPNLQKYIHQEHEEIYQQLATKHLFFQNLKFYSVRTLEAVYSMKHLPMTVKTEEKKCQIKEEEKIVYAHKDADDKTLLKVISEFFSCGDEVCQGKIQIFLMTSFPSIKNPKQRLEAMTKEYKLKSLPKNETLWLVDEIVVYKPPEAPKVEPEVRPEAEVKEEGKEFVLRCWPPPRPANMPSGGENPETESERKFPKPPKPDKVDYLPETLQRKPRADDGHHGNHGKTNKVAPMEGQGEAGPKRSTESRDVKPPGDGPKSDSVKPKSQAAVKGGEAPVEGGEGEGGVVRGNTEKKREREPADLVLGDFVMSKQTNKDDKNRNVTDGNDAGSAKNDVPAGNEDVGVKRRKIDVAGKAASDDVSRGESNSPSGDVVADVSGDVTIGPLPMTPARVATDGKQRTPQTVRQFRPDDIEDIPDERVFYETGNHDVTPSVEIRLDVASNQKEIGRHGEELVYKFLQARIGQQHNKELDPDTKETITKVTWVNEQKETGKPYDIELKTELDREKEVTRFIEVKSTMSESKMYFESSINELLFAYEQGENYDLYRVFSVGNKDKVKLVKLQHVSHSLEEKKIRVFMVA